MSSILRCRFRIARTGYVFNCDSKWTDKMPQSRIRRLALCALLLAVISACAEVPQQELSIYVDAYNQARSSSEQVLIDLVASREKIRAYHAEKAARETQPAVTLGDYVPPTKRESGFGPDAITVRLAALALVSQYNDILVAIAEGKKVGALQAKVQGAAVTATRLLSLAGTTIPGAGGLTGLLQTIASVAQKYADRQAFAEAIKEGAPLVKQIVQFLIDETPLIVEVHEGVWDAESASLRGQANRIVRSIKAEARQHGPPAPGSPEEARVAEIESNITEQLTQIRQGEVRLSFDGATPVTPEVLGQLETDLPQVEAATRAFLENRQKSPALRALMDQYVNSLSTTQNALDNVSLALDRPVDFTRVATELLEAAISIKQQYATYKAALSKP